MFDSRRSLLERITEQRSLLRKESAIVENSSHCHLSTSSIPKASRISSLRLKPNVNSHSSHRNIVNDGKRERPGMVRVSSVISRRSSLGMSQTMSSSTLTTERNNKEIHTPNGSANAEFSEEPIHDRPRSRLIPRSSSNHNLMDILSKTPPSLSEIFKQRETIKERFNDQLHSLYSEDTPSERVDNGKKIRRQRLSNEERISNRSNHSKAIVDDLCEIVCDLYTAESKLLDSSTCSMSSSNLSVYNEIKSFISSLPIRYAMSVNSPSLVLVHMRLINAAKKGNVAVHVGTINENDLFLPLFKTGKSNWKVVTVSCTDTHGILECMIKMLGSSGSRVLDGEIMLTSEGLVLNRFIVEMKGKLLLDKFQERIQAYQRNTHLSNTSQNSEMDSLAQSAPIMASPDRTTQRQQNQQQRSTEQLQCDSLYFNHDPSSLSSSRNQFEEIQNAVPLLEFLSETNDPKTHYTTTEKYSRHSHQCASEASSDSPEANTATDTPPAEPSSEAASVSKKKSRRKGSARRLVNRNASQDLLEIEEEKKPSNNAMPSNITTIPIEHLMLIEKLGNGRVSTVYKAGWEQKKERGADNFGVKIIALKVANCSSRTEELEELKREAEIGSILKHENLVGLWGVASGPGCFCLALEYCENGSLLSLLSDSNRCYEYLPIALDIANGMSYLHSLSVIHRDLKPANILLTKGNRVKISDFGMSVANYNGQELTAETGTYRWMAPEVIRHESYSSNADVYSFGIVFWQLITRQVPFSTMTPIQTAYAVAEGQRPELFPNIPSVLQRIISTCWDEDSVRRPSFTYITMALADYVKMAFHPSNVGTSTLQIANDVLANVRGNSTVNVDFSAR